jgi:superfamily II DNA/RNA helicase
MSFADLGLGPELLRAIEQAGYSEPTPIQEKAIPPILLSRDVLGCAQTGTGKTAGYALPMIEMLERTAAKARMARSLVLAPTRELAQQIANAFETLGCNHGLRLAVVIGGESMADQQKLIERGVDVLIATPGRLLDLYERGSIMLGSVKILVIDEADRMLDMGFIPDVERIVSLLPRIRQTLLFSATLGPDIKRLADAFLINAKEITIDPSATVAETVDHAVVRVEPRAKREALLHFLRSDSIASALIFCNRKKDIGPLCQYLRRNRVPVGELHGDMPQSRRTETLAAFKAGTIRMLVSSDVAGRGLDIESVSHVFNFDVPSNPEDYVHRIGRTGRAGRSGRAITLATADDDITMKSIGKLIGRAVPEIPAPNGTAAGASTTIEPRPRAAPSHERARHAPRNGRRHTRSGEREPPEPREPREPVSQIEEPAVPVALPVHETTESAEQVVARPARETKPPKPKWVRNEAPSETYEKSVPLIGMGDHVPDFLRLPVRPMQARDDEP